MRNLFLLLFTISFLFIKNTSTSQNSRQGNHFIQNYNHTDYHTPENQTWAILQDGRGVMFFGNNNGILEFDGTYWRLIPLKNKSTVRSFALDTVTNTIYVGGVGELGYLKPDSNGKLTYISLNDKLPSDRVNFEDVWQITVLNDKILFRTTYALYILKDNKFNVLVPDDRFHTSFCVNKQYYIREWGKGLFQLKGDSLEYIGQSRIFADERIYIMLPYLNNKILIATRTQGVYIFSPNSVTNKFIKPDKFNTINSFLTDNQSYCGIKTVDNLYGIGTFQDGIIIFNEDGKIIYHINKDKGLGDDHVLSLYSDLHNNIWVGLNNGISQINTNSPYTYYNDKNGLDGTVYYVKIYKNKLYAGTSLGLYVKGNGNSFELIENTKGQCWSLSEVNGDLYLAHSYGIFKINNNTATQIITGIGTVWNINKIEKKPFLIIGTDNGVFLAEEKGGKLILIQKIEGFNESARYLKFSDNDVWISHENKGIYRLTLNESYDSLIHIQFYNSKDGLPSNTKNYVYKLSIEKNKEQIFFGTENGIYTFDNQNNSFTPYNTFSNLLNHEGFIDRFVQDDHGNIYFQQGQTKGILQIQNDGSYKLSTPFHKLQDLYLEYITVIDSANILLCSREGIIKYDPSIKPLQQNYKTLIRSINANDSLLFGGDKNLNEEIELSIKYNNLEIAFSALFYEDHTKTKYSYILEGYGSPSNEWSEWSLKTEKEYTNLQSGDYIFRVKAINTYDEISSEAYFTFKILTPWYRTILAYVIYGIIAILLIWIIVNIFTSKLKIEKEVLEGIVLERTKDLQETNTQLEEKQADLEIKQEEIKEQSKKIERANRELEKHKNHLEKLVENRTHDLQLAKEKAEESDRLKTAFLANMSHEIRTPMNAIIGFADLLNDPEIDNNVREELINLINHNSDTLLRLIDDIIDISKIESCQLHISKRFCSINDILNKLIITFKEKRIAMKKGHIKITLTQDPNFSDVNLETDPLRFQQIITNFIDNALKFTEEGSIDIGYDVNRSYDNITFYVKDTGIGLKENETELIFERFNKIDSKNQKLYRGAGLGLTISKNLAKLLGGKIWVDSKVNKGSTFYFSLPFNS